MFTQLSSISLWRLLRNYCATYFSSRDKLGKAVVYILRFKAWLLNKVGCKLGQTKGQCLPMKGRVTVAETLIAEQDILRFVQKKRLFLKKLTAAYRSQPE